MRQRMTPNQIGRAIGECVASSSIEVRSAAANALSGEFYLARSEEARLAGENADVREANARYAQQVVALSAAIQQSNATIKALADALQLARDLGISSQTAWEASTAALRLAGRLP